MRRCGVSALGETWHKSTASNNNSACVEVCLADGQVQVRDTKALGRGPILGFDPAAWSAFVADARQGKFDL